VTTDWLAILAIFVGTIVVVMLFFELGYRLGTSAHRASAEEKETAISGVAGAVLGLNAFLLAFTFSAVADRYQDRKALVRDDANAIRIAYVRADFLPAADRAESKRLLAHYLDQRLAFAKAGSFAGDELPRALADIDDTQRRLWRIAVSNAERDMNSDVAALYIESLNDLTTVQTHRLAKIRARIPMIIWIALCALTVFGMLSMGYHTGLSDSKRSKSTLIVAISFAMVIAMVEGLDRPDFIRVSQQPLVDLQGFIAADH